MQLGRHTQLPNQGSFTFACSVILDIYELPFPGFVWTAAPWAGGYVAAPLMYVLIAYGPLSRYFSVTPWLQPLLPLTYLKEPVYVESVRAVLCGMFVFHFIRRLLETLFLNRYTSNTKRMSDVELSYYFLWGVLHGWAGLQDMMASFGGVPMPVFAVGLLLWFIGQSMNCFCHVQLRWLKEEAKGAHIVPYRFPFQYFVMPHYNFEMVSWTGFAVCTGANVPSIVTWCLSLCVLQVWTHAKRAQYIRMHRDGQIPSGQDKSQFQPAERWGLFPGL
eukprot:CAMPEP_0179145706 /NCGR_PEP_ID=MMETSP0796-20121207/70318_1 /TAXON_ID=73915 /ORGANISM="Pyrodinium bahamense, Strain pbaha01" /LENGTH=274 /DNA_ID=CAMNT_0020846125 /DNA_START=119 /DNA_END=943 /DNA_ORIENTATION=+